VLERIIVGYAGDRAGRDAVKLAGALAAPVGGQLTVVFPYHPLFASRDADELQLQVAAEVDELLGWRGEGARPIEPTFHWTSSPWPIHALHELAAYEKASLIVIGAAKEDLADRMHLSLMERMVHGAPCAVAVAPAGYEPKPLKRIGVGFASSREGRVAATLACQLAERTNGEAKVIAGAGLEPALASYSFSSPALVEVEEEIYNETVETLEHFCAELPDGATLERDVIRGDPAEVLIEASAQLDLLVLGSRAYGPLRHVLLGSVSARVMREARCPVLVIPRVVAGGNERDHEQRATAAQQR
jgi:nucleotide-binding universal stress UspA family protein